MSKADDMPVIEQRHRDAAADYIDGELAYPTSRARFIREGQSDGDSAVQAFARFERDLAARSLPTADGLLRECREVLNDYLCAASLALQQKAIPFDGDLGVQTDRAHDMLRTIDAHLASAPTTAPAKVYCSADGCHRTEPCGPFCRDNGNFDQAPTTAQVAQVGLREAAEYAQTALLIARGKFETGGKIADVMDRAMGGLEAALSPTPPTEATDEEDGLRKAKAEMQQARDLLNTAIQRMIDVQVAALSTKDQGV